jgi:threonylcarbamoyladenosine tRNA methylthiotransferase MtaB
MKFSFYTLGCKVNQFETQAMEQALLERGHTLGTFDEPCDCYIVNTCTVTAVSDKKSRNALRRARKLNPAAVIGVCGCYAQVSPEEVEKLDVDVVGGTGDRMAFLDLMEQTAGDRQRKAAVDNALRRRQFEFLPAGGLQARTRAMLKVQDGCVNFCTYCIIPYARGPVRSLPLETAVAEAKRLAAEGYRELVVTGIEISSYGVDFKDGTDLKTLLAALCTAVPEVRIRLGSLEPRTVDEAFCEALKDFPNLCPQFHLSLQSGSDTVLQRMRRKYDTARYLHSCDLLREAFPGCAITTDLIVAFPGETEAEFAETLAFIQRCRFSAMHIFPYSRREGTPAAAMDGQHANAVKAERAARAEAVAHELALRYEAAMVGQTVEVLFEQEKDGLYTGHAPNYVLVGVESDEDLHNQILPVTVTAVMDGGVRGELVRS